MKISNVQIEFYDTNKRITAVLEVTHASFAKDGTLVLYVAEPNRAVSAHCDMIRQCKLRMGRLSPVVPIKAALKRLSAGLTRVK